MLDIHVDVTRGAALAEWMTAFGTLGAVLVALFGPMLWAWWRSPRLEIGYEPREPYCRDTQMERRYIAEGALFQAHWIRVKVRNRGRGTAKSCKGKMIAVYRADGSLREDRDSMLLKWAGIPEDQQLTPLDLAPHEWQFLNVTRADSEYPTKALVATDFDARPGFPQTLEAGQTHKVRLAVYADNAEPVTRDFVIEFNGDIHSLEIRPA